MGAFLSSFLGGGDTALPEDSHVKAFHSSARWQLHLNELKDTPKLVNP